MELVVPYVMGLVIDAHLSLVIALLMLWTELLLMFHFLCCPLKKLRFSCSLRYGPNCPLFYRPRYSSTLCYRPRCNCPKVIDLVIAYVMGLVMVFPNAI